MKGIAGHIGTVHVVMAAGAAIAFVAGLAVAFGIAGALSGGFIVCSALNYRIPGILGSVWYNGFNDLDSGFKEVLDRLEKGS